ncbi:host attachment protein [Devosia sp. YIM 151766]|uniref:host attachment protein n=1 Tax=Devosia sp. YIM 151766 TaxID=3017325 RepID=UPI00255CEB5C|nr:host attachment protein [Devosia sp. YIM 151766]WIY54058.1 host attachment protein [Devosia sp. YIM 151766]
MAENHGSRHVIIVAPPRALGVLRPLLGTSTRNVLKAELTSDLVRHKVSEIERHLAALTPG